MTDNESVKVLRVCGGKMKKKFFVLTIAVALCVCLSALCACVDTDLNNYDYPDGFEDMLAQSYSDRQDETDLRIMSFNMLVHIAGWGGLPVEPRAKMFTAVLDKYMPDIIAGQEVCSDWHKVLKDNIYDKYEVIEPKINLFSYNKTPLFFNKNTLTLIESGYMPYSEGDNNGCRAVTWGLFEIKASGKRVVVTDTHLDLIRGKDIQKELAVMSRQADELLALLDELTERYGCAILACGDYNSQENGEGTDSHGNPLGDYAAAEIYAKLAEKTTDIKYAEGVNVIGQSDATYEPTWDHIFAVGEVGALDFFVLCDELYLEMSDHYAIIADVILT